MDASGSGSASITLGTRSAATAVLALEVNAAVSGEMQGAVSVAASRTLNAGALVVPTQLAISGPGSIDSSSAALTFTAYLAPPLPSTPISTISSVVGLLCLAVARL